MIRFGARLSAENALEIGIITRLTNDYVELIAAAVKEVKDLEGKVQHISNGPVEIAEIEFTERPMAGKLPLSSEVVEIISRAIKDAARAPTFAEALEVGYKAFGHVACTEAAKEGIAAFLQKRTPEYGK